MSPEFIKICGLSTPDAVEAVINGGATHLGLIFYGKSPRNVSLHKAQQLSAQSKGHITSVAVTVNASDEFLDEIVSQVSPAMLQLHGSESPDRTDEVRKRFGLPVIKALAIASEADIKSAKDYIGHADFFLFDAKAPAGSDLPGGNGVAFDWEIMDQWPQDVPYILSGGLNSSNLAEAIERTKAFGIDASSGVESSPGVKDIELIREFLRTARQEEERVE